MLHALQTRRHTKFWAEEVQEFYWKRLCIVIVIYVYLLLVYVRVVYVLSMYS